MSVMQIKICESGRKPKQGNQNKICRFCGMNLESVISKFILSDIKGGIPGLILV